MGGQCALLKVTASRVFEYCAREASQIFGGNSIVKEGKGMHVERYKIFLFEFMFILLLHQIALSFLQTRANST